VYQNAVNPADHVNNGLLPIDEDENDEKVTPMKPKNRRQFSMKDNSVQGSVEGRESHQRE
jgi:hypothetical protein